MIGTDGTEKEKKMKRTQKWLSFAAGMLLILMLGAVSAAAEEGDRTQTLRSNLEESGFYVQQGLFRELDTVKLASEGKLMSCFGNNAGSAYVVFSLPAAPDQNTSLGSEARGWPDEMASAYDDPAVVNDPANPYFAPGGWEYKLRQDEAIVLITPLPQECKYYSFINYIMFTEDNHGLKWIATGGYYLGGRGNIRKALARMKSGDGYVRIIAELANNPDFDIKITPYQKN